jgi:hypothetical protein
VPALDPSSQRELFAAFGQCCPASGNLNILGSGGVANRGQCSRLRIVILLCFESRRGVPSNLQVNIHQESGAGPSTNFHDDFGIHTIELQGHGARRSQSVSVDAVHCVAMVREAS